MNSLVLLLVLGLYMALLFGIAGWAEKRRHSRWVNNPYIYTLSLAVFCTTWTYYGSIGVAADTGLSYLPIYLGPIIIAPAWVVIMKKIIRIAKAHNMASIADFISLRYGNSRWLGALVTLIALVGILPYLALQLKAIAETFHLVTQTPATSGVFMDSTTYIAIALALFTSYYGTRFADASEKRKGIVVAVALESVFKLFFFLLVGAYVTYEVFDGVGDIYQKAQHLPQFEARNSIQSLEQALNWSFLLLLSMMAVFLLPRQFHMAVIENNKEKHVNTALWMFPLYLLLFNVFVFPMAWGGNVLFAGQTANADFYSLLIPQHFGQTTLQVLVFLGGFSAAISMVIVSAMGLSIMLTNNVLIPYNLLGGLQTDAAVPSNRRIVMARRWVIFAIIILAYLIYRYFGLAYHLVSIGMVSFVIIAQLAPAFFGALFWRRGARVGAWVGMAVGLLISIYTLLIPYALGTDSSVQSLMEQGPWGIRALRPFHLLNIEGLDPIPHAMFWSLGANTLLFALISVSRSGNYRERNMAEMYVDVDRYMAQNENAYVWKGTAYWTDIEKVLRRFLGEARTQRALTLFQAKYRIEAKPELADARLIKFAENLLTGHIGTASARILIAGVAQEEKISLTEVLQILEESKQHILVNKKLTENAAQLQMLTQQLQLANAQLLQQDAQKDEFLDTVTHELRTPITAIKASSELLLDEDDLPDDLRKQFLNNIVTESDRLSRLIDKILDLEKMESGQQQLQWHTLDFAHLMQQVQQTLQSLFAAKQIEFMLQCESPLPVTVDPERIQQVLHNLLSNALKFCPEQGGHIVLEAQVHKGFLEVRLTDNGRGIPHADLAYVFDKFYQSTQQNLRKPVGSGLGLAISRQIIELHGGRIWAEPVAQGACFCFRIPLHPPVHHSSTILPT